LIWCDGDRQMAAKKMGHGGHRRPSAADFFSATDC